MPTEMSVIQEGIIREAINKFNTTNGEMESEILRMADAVQSFDSAWTGKAREAFGSSFVAIKKNLATVNDNLKLLVTDLENTLANTQETEKGVESAFSSAADTTSPFSI